MSSRGELLNLILLRMALAKCEVEVKERRRKEYKNLSLLIFSGGIKNLFY